MERILLTGQRRRGALLAIVLLLGTIGAAVGDPAPLPHPAPALPPAAIAAARDLFSMPGIVAAMREAVLRFEGGIPPLPRRSSIGLSTSTPPWASFKPAALRSYC